MPTPPLLVIWIATTLFFDLSYILFEFMHLVAQEKLFSSKNRMEASLGKKLKIDMLPEIEKEHKVLYFYVCLLFLFFFSLGW